MVTKLEREILRTGERKKKIELREKLLKEKEKQVCSRRFREVGKIAFEAGIDQLDSDILLGAFLEISELSKENNYIEKWKLYAENHSKKTTNFRWNSPIDYFHF